MANHHSVNKAFGLRAEELFLQAFNSKFKNKNIYLHPSLNEYDVFDFWLLNVDNTVTPTLVELKARPNKKSDTFPDAVINYDKVLNLRSKAGECEARIFLLYEDKTLVIDPKVTPDFSTLVDVFEGRKLLARYISKNLASLPIGLANLQLKLVDI